MRKMNFVNCNEVLVNLLDVMKSSSTLRCDFIFKFVHLQAFSGMNLI